MPVKGQVKKDVEDKMSFLQDRIQLVDRFATARR